jgi:hypothetical protein
VGTNHVELADPPVNQLAVLCSRIEDSDLLGTAWLSLHRMSGCEGCAGIDAVFVGTNCVDPIAGREVQQRSKGIIRKLPGQPEHAHSSQFIPEARSEVTCCVQ